MLKLMIVDDSNIIRNKIKRSLNSDRYQLIADANDGEKAIAQFQASPCDVVTMDLTMPNVDGIGCIEQLIKIQPDVLILVVSALSDKATGIEALQKGARGFLLKPFTEDQLIHALDELTEHCHV